MQLLLPGKSREGHDPPTPHGYPFFNINHQNGTPMAFVNEVASDEDIARYGLPFQPGSGRYWTRDKENDCYLWGGIVENYALGCDPQGQFDFYVHGILLRVYLNMGSGSSSFKDSPYRIIWKEVSHIQPHSLCGLSLRDTLIILKRALVVFGYDGRQNLFAKSRVVEFDF